MGFFFFKQKTAYEIMPSLVGSEMCIRDRNITKLSRASVHLREGRTLRGTRALSEILSVTKSLSPDNPREKRMSSLVLKRMSVDLSEKLTALRQLIERPQRLKDD
eukprot:TRINITY_DN3625_c0_g1_i6.p1 TRINITY_DN3625_c0_g1~~TRINITY_DN3625_c0_g1_i6.p1  ORF type:complete len:105 (-),score=27.40 TRINITY_DN3625_c0_g1_i6:80-394(-)